MERSKIVFSCEAVPRKSFDHFWPLLTTFLALDFSLSVRRRSLEVLQQESSNGSSMEDAQTQIHRELGFLTYPFHKPFYFLILILFQAKANSTCFFMLLLCAHSYFNPNHLSAKL